MEAHQRQQFDVLLLTAADRLAERAVQRCAGRQEALLRLRTDPDGEGVWRAEFVDAVFAEFCLDTADGAAFVLAALQRRPAPAVGGAGPPPAPGAPSGPAPPVTIGALLIGLAKAAFADLLGAKVIESLSRTESYG